MRSMHDTTKKTGLMTKEGNAVFGSAASLEFHKESARRLYVQLLHLHPLKFRLSYHHSTTKPALFRDFSAMIVAMSCKRN